MAMHGFGMLLILRVNGALKHRFGQNSSFTSGMFILVLASWMILIVHLVEVLSWAAFFLWKNAVNADNVNSSLCYYFALMDYTTLGCDYNLVPRWRLLEGMIAIAGLLTFAWSTPGRFADAGAGFSGSADATPQAEAGEAGSQPRSYAPVAGRTTEVKNPLAATRSAVPRPALQKRSRPH